jgi:glycosyltransferase involved in cell wall biosynthesis
VIRVTHIIARMNVGGPAQIISALLTGCDPTVISQQLVVGEVSPGEEDWYALREPEHADDPRIHRIAGFGRAIDPVRDPLTLRRLTRHLVRTAPDVVVTHTAKAGLLGRLAAQRAGVPHVVHMFHGHTLRGYFPGPVTGLFTGLERRLARRTDTLLAVGSRVRDELLAAGVGHPGQYEVLPPGVPDAGTDDRAAARQALGLADTAMVVSFIGRLTRVKRPDRFLAAAELVAAGRPETVFLVVGDGESRAGLEGRTTSADVRFLGWRGDVGTVHAASDVIVLTSDNEGMPVALIEAAMAGRPCVTTDVGAAAEVVLDGRSGAVVPPEAAAIAAAVERLLADDRLRAEFGAAARAHALASFGQAALVSRFSATILAGPQGSNPEPRDAA